MEDVYLAFYRHMHNNPSPAILGGDKLLSMLLPDAGIKVNNCQLYMSGYTVWLSKIAETMFTFGNKLVNKSQADSITLKDVIGDETLGTKRMYVCNDGKLLYAFDCSVVKPNTISTCQYELSGESIYGPVMEYLLANYILDIIRYRKDIVQSVYCIHCMLDMTSYDLYDVVTYLLMKMRDIDICSFVNSRDFKQEFDKDFSIVWNLSYSKTSCYKSTHEVGNEINELFSSLKKQMKGRVPAVIWD